MASDNEFEVSPQQMAAEVQALNKENGINPGTAPADIDKSLAESFNAPEPLPESDVEVPDAGFWKDNDPDFGDALDNELGNNPAHESNEEIPEEKPSGDPKIFKYKANGKEIELDLSNPEQVAELQKKLAQADGMQKAFSDKAKLARQAKKMQKQIDELAAFKESWAKLEELKNDEAKLHEFITGESYEDTMKKRIAKAKAYELATDEERRVMDQEDQMMRLKADMDRRDADIKRREEAAEQERYQAKYDNHKSVAREQFKKYVQSDTPDHLKEAFWDASFSQMRKYVNKYGKLTNKMIEKSFESKAKLFIEGYNKQVESKVDKVIEEKKETSKAKAQQASAKNYEGAGLGGKDLTSLDPMKLFRQMQKRAK